MSRATVKGCLLGSLLVLAALSVPTSTAAITLSTPQLVSPVNAAADVVTGPILDWANVSGATQYRLFVHENKAVLQAIGATQTTCAGCRVNAVTSTSMFRFSYSDPLAPRRWYYWMVRAGSSTGGSQNSAIWSFRAGDEPVIVGYDSGVTLGVDYYIVKVRLDSGARVEAFLGAKQSTGSGNNCATAGRPYYRFAAKKLADFVAGSAEIRGARAAISGGFHDDTGRPAFPQKVRSTIETYGTTCANDEPYRDRLRMLEIRNSDGRAFVDQYQLTKFQSSTIAPTVIVGLHPDLAVDANWFKGRNFACVKDASGGGYRTVIFIISDGMLSKQAKAVLVSLGCSSERVIQFDGSSTAQISEKVGSDWKHRITTERKMPQMFAIYNPN